MSTQSIFVLGTGGPLAPAPSAHHHHRYEAIARAAAWRRRRLKELSFRWFDRLSPA
jgi:hypothetical protein